MNHKTRLLLIAAFFVLALPLVFMGNASAGYVSDGGFHNGASTGWQIPPVNPGVNGCLADSTKAGKPDCNTVRFPAYTSAAACSAAPEFTQGKVEFASVCTAADGVTPINLSGLSRTALNCDSLGGTYAAACVGKWTDVTDLSGGTTYQCLRCHNNTYQRNSAVYRWKTSTLKHGHKNMLRKVTAGQPWEGPDGLVYDVHAAGSGTTIDWTNATVTTTSMTPATRALYYIYGDWMAPAPSLVYDNSAAGDGSSAKYTCASCHTTGYVATNNVATMQPELTYPNINSGVTGSWDVDGIVCSRCHNATSEGTSFVDPYRTSLGWGSDTTSFTTHETENFGDPYGTDGALITALCIECHNSTQTKTDPAGQLKTAATGTGFSGHILGNQFLNSTHGKFTGTSGQVGTEANYDSHFSAGRCLIFKTGVTSTSGQFVEAANKATCDALAVSYGGTSTWTSGYYGGSCATCHDVHQSIVPEVGADEPLRRECTHCHTQTASTTKHPTMAGTPVGLAGGDNAVACEVCHMATESVEGSTHLPVHLWRINTSATYRTFPTPAEWSAGTKIANTAPDGDYTNAVWVDLDLACGQCHGGSLGASGTKNGAMYFDKTVLAAYAAGMHTAAQLPPTVSHTGGADVLKGAATTITDTSVGNNHEAQSSLGVSINWGDGAVSTGVGGAAFTHTYANAGVYNVVHSASSGNLVASEPVFKVKVVAGTSITKSKITVTVMQSNGTTPISGARVYLKKAGVLKTTGYSNASGVWVFSNLLPAADYTVEVYKSGVNFGNGVGKMSTATTVDATADATLTVTAVTP